MEHPTFITHYFETDRGPFLNVCDLPDTEVQRLIDEEKNSETAFNRFSLGSNFMRWRRSADDLLIRAYDKKFGFPPVGRPFLAVLGEFDKTLTMFRNGNRVRLDLDGFADHEVTFMYPDHAHLTSYDGAEVPHLFYQPHHMPNGRFWGQLYTFQELLADFESSRTSELIEEHIQRDGWAGYYVEAHIWCRDQRTKIDEQDALSDGGQRPSLNSGFPSRRGRARYSTRNETLVLSNSLRIAEPDSLFRRAISDPDGNAF